MERFVKHPFWKKSDAFKYTYCFGLGVMAMGHMKAIAETQQFFEETLEQIALPPQQCQQILPDINNQFERMLDQVIRTIRTKEEQYCFVLDLYSIRRHTSWARQYCDGVLEEYLQIFQFSAMERIFFQDLDRAMTESDPEKATGAYRCFVEEGYHIRYDVVTYFYPEFCIQAQAKGLHIETGKALLLDVPMTIHGDVVVERGASLMLHGAKIQITGGIYVKGGKLQIDHADILVEGCSGEYLMNLENVAVVTITDSRIDCNRHCGLLKQNTGRLLIEDCELRHMAGVCGIFFSGRSVRIAKSRFYQGTCGMLSLSNAADAKIYYCDFEGGEASYGGAIYSESMGDVVIWQCVFRKCRARYLGSAVYFKYQKMGQSVWECDCLQCEPSTEPFFNVVSKEIYQAEKMGGKLC